LEEGLKERKRESLGRSASDKEAAGDGVESLKMEAIGNCKTPSRWFDLYHDINLLVFMRFGRGKVGAPFR